ncbi:hypothetical protein NQ314_005076, partial [Rhamnusium bicolor]
WSNFLNEVTDTSKFGKPADFDAVTKRGNLFSTMNFWYANIGIIVYGVTTLAEASYCKRINEDKGLHEVCGSIAPMWLPFEDFGFRMSNQLNVLVKFTVGHISLISAIVFGCIGNQIFKVKPIGAALYLAGYMIALFWLCHSGQRIMDEIIKTSYSYLTLINQTL